MRVDRFAEVVGAVAAVERVCAALGIHRHDFQAAQRDGNVGAVADLEAVLHLDRALLRSSAPAVRPTAGSRSPAAGSRAFCFGVAGPDEEHATAASAAAARRIRMRHTKTGRDFA